MDIRLTKWRNNIGFLIPEKIAESFGLDENSIIELTESQEGERNFGWEKGGIVAIIMALFFLMRRLN